MTRANKDPELDIKRRNAAIENARTKLQELPAAGHENQILGVKSIEVGLRLAVQLSIVGLHELGNSYDKISRLLAAKGYTISKSQVAKLAQGTEHTPNPAILPVLINVYKEVSTVFWEAWQEVTL